MHNVSKEKHNTSPGNKGQMTKTTLIFATNRAMNNKTVECVLNNDDTKFNEHNLNVICKHPLCLYTGS